MTLSETLSEIRTRRLSLGEMIQAGWQIYYSRFSSVLLITLSIVLPLYILLHLLTLHFQPALLTLRESGQSLESLTPDVYPEEAMTILLPWFGQFIRVMGIFLVAYTIVLGIFGPLAGMAISLMTERAVLGEDLNWVQALKRSLERLWSAFWTGLLYSSVLFLGFCCCCFPGIWLSWVYMFTYYVVVLRQRGGLNAMNYAAQVFKSNRWSTIGSTIVIFLPLILFTFLLNQFLAPFIQGTFWQVGVEVTSSLIIYLGQVMHTLLFLNLDYCLHTQSTEATP